MVDNRRLVNQITLAICVFSFIHLLHNVPNAFKLMKDKINLKSSSAAKFCVQNAGSGVKPWLRMAVCGQNVFGRDFFLLFWIVLKTKPCIQPSTYSNGWAAHKLKALPLRVSANQCKFSIGTSPVEKSHWQASGGCEASGAPSLNCIPFV